MCMRFDSIYRGNEVLVDEARSPRLVDGDAQLEMGHSIVMDHALPVCANDTYSGIAPPWMAPIRGWVQPQ